MIPTPTEEPSPLDDWLVEDLLRREGDLETRPLDPDDVPGSWDSLLAGLLELGPRKRAPRLPQRLGRFEIRERVGAGGFGAVYRAYDPLSRREVALKVLHRDLTFSADARRRFLGEAAAVAMLDHPGIVPVYESGDIGRYGPYLVSEFCEGATLSKWLAARPGPVPAPLAARLVADLAAAVEHAHRRGVVHRDLKPNNILLVGRLEADEVRPRITDFGLAKRLQEAGDGPRDATRPGQQLGSPPFMAPEQATGYNAGVGPAADVYALGAILYTVLTGRPPLRGINDFETLRLVLDAEPVPPRALSPGLPRALETICLKCLEKSPARRYASAAALAGDLGRFLDGRRIAARPPGAALRLARWSRKRPFAAASTILLAFALAGLGAAAAWHGQVLRRHNNELAASLAREKERARQVEHHLDASRLRAAGQALEVGNTIHAQELLDLMTARDDGRNLRGFARSWLLRQARREATLLWTHAANTRSMCLGPDGTTLAVGDASGTILVGDLRGTRPPVRLIGHTGIVNALALSPDGRLLASTAEGQATIWLWDTASGRCLAEAARPTATGTVSLRFMAGGRRLAACFDAPAVPGVLALYDVVASAPRLRAGRQLRPAAEPAFDPTGRLLAIPVDADRLEVIDASTEAPVRTFAGRGPARLPAFSPDGRRLAVHYPRELVVWDVAQGREVARLATPTVGNAPPALSRDGSVVAAVGPRGSVRFLDVARGAEGAVELDKATTEDPSVRLALSADGRKLATLSRDLEEGVSILKVWDLETRRARDVLAGQPLSCSNMAFAPDGRTAAVLSDHHVLQWGVGPPSAADPPPRVDHGGEWVWSLTFSPDGRILASGGDDFRIVLRDRAGAGPPVVLAGHTEAVDALAFSPDGRTLASGSQEPSNHLKLWDLATCRERMNLVGHTHKVRSVVFNRTGTVLASSSFDGTARTWDAATGRSLRILKGHADLLHKATLSPDGRTLASGSDDGTVRLWDVASGRPLKVFNHGRVVLAVAFSPAGDILAASDVLGTITLRDPETGKTLLTIRTDPAEVRTLAFSPDGDALAGAGGGGTVRLWDTVTGQELLALRGHQAQVNALAFSPDGMTLASGSHDGSVRLWTTRDAEPAPRP